MNMAFSPSSRLLAASYRDGKIKVLDVTTGASVQTFSMLNDGPTHDPVAFNLAETQVYSADESNNIYVWDLADPRKNRKFKFEKNTKADSPGVSDLRALADGKRLLVLRDGTAKIFEIGTGKELDQIKVEQGFYLLKVVGEGFVAGKEIPNCALNEIWFFSFSDRKNPFLLDKPQQCERPKIKDDSGDESVDFEFGEPKIFVSREQDKIAFIRTHIAGLRVWTVGSKTVDSVNIPNSSDAKSVLAVTDDFQFLLVGNDNGQTVQSFGGAKITDLRQFSSSAENVVAARDGHTFLMQLAGHEEGNVRAWKWQVSGLTPRLLELEDSSKFVVRDMSINGTLVLADKEGSGEVGLFSGEDGKKQASFAIDGAKSISEARISGDGKFGLVIGAHDEDEWDGAVATLFNFADKTSQKFVVLKEDANGQLDRSMRIAAFSRDASRFALSYSDGTVEVWTRDPLRKVTGFAPKKDEEPRPFSLLFSDDGRYLFCGTMEDGLFIWDLTTNKKIATLEDENSLAGYANMRTVALSHDGNTVAVGITERAQSSGDVGTELGVKVWDRKSKKLLYTLRGHKGGVTAVAFSADDKWIISGSHDGTVRYWDRKDGSWLATFAVVKDGRWLFITQDGVFAGSRGSEQLVHVVRNLETFGVEQFQQALFRSDLVDKFLKGDPDRGYQNAVVTLNLDSILSGGSPPQIEMLPNRPVEKFGDSVRITLRLVDTGGGIGDQVDWKVNHITSGSSDNPTQAVVDRGSGYVVVSEIVKIDPTRRNLVEVTAYNGKGLLASEPFPITIDAFGVTTPTKPRPRLFVIAIGISKYVRQEWVLQYAASDAAAFVDKIKLVAKPLYEEPIHAQLLVDERATKQGIIDAFESVKKDIRATDVFILFVAGHGRTVQKSSSYFFIPQDLVYDGNHTVEDGIGPQIWTKLLKQIAAQKSIMIFDTCESAAAVGLTRGSEETESAINRLNLATGRSVITAARQAAYEGYHEHGVLTYSILEALSDRKGTSSEIDLETLSKFTYEEVPKISLSLFGLPQQPHNLIEGNFPIGVVAGLVPEGDETIPSSPTHFVSKSGRLRERPEESAPGDRILPIGYNVRVVTLLPGGWALIARDGQKIGYFHIDDLGKNL
jgi:WD40 repeat protein